MEEENTKEKPVKKLGPLTLEMVKMINSQQQLKENSQSEDCAKSMKMNDAAMQHHSVDEWKVSDRVKIKTPKPIDFNFLKLTINQIKLLSTDDLLKLLSGEGHKGAIQETTVQLISNEILSRQIKESGKPHWTVTPTFVVACIASVLAAISILVTIYFSVFYKAENNNKHTDQGYTAEKNSNP